MDYEALRAENERYRAKFDQIGQHLAEQDAVWAARHARQEYQPARSMVPVVLIGLLVVLGVVGAFWLATH